MAVTIIDCGLHGVRSFTWEYPSGSIVNGACVRVALAGRGVEDDSRTRRARNCREQRRIRITRQSTVDASPDKAIVSHGRDRYL